MPPKEENEKPVSIMVEAMKRQFTDSKGEIMAGEERIMTDAEYYGEQQAFIMNQLLTEDVGAQVRGCLQGRSIGPVTKKSEEKVPFGWTDQELSNAFHTSLRWSDLQEAARRAHYRLSASVFITDDNYAFLQISFKKAAFKSLVKKLRA